MYSLEQIQAQAVLELRRRQAEAERQRLAIELAKNLADWAQPLFQPSRYKCLFGGRGSGKSWAIAEALLIIGLTRKIRVLCAREFQISIKDSVHHLLKERIEALGLGHYYQVLRDAIVAQNGSTFLFKGVRHNVQSIKSMSGITHCWLEEAQTISAESWKIIVPTIREEESEIWVSFNPVHKTDPIYQELVSTVRSNAYVERVNWDRNPYFPAVLDEERRQMQATDMDAYLHIWEGGFWEKSEAQILNGKWVVEDFEPDPETWDGPYHGGDWGFSTDPTAAVKLWIHQRKLFVEQESYAHQLELDDIGRLWIADIPEIDRHVVRADSSRPETISHVKRGRRASQTDPGCPPIPMLEAVEKWPGSVEDGIAHLRSYEKIVVHPRCKHFQEEARLYCYKVDRISGDILPIVVDAHNHLIDATRYALAPLIQAGLDGSWVSEV